MCIRDRVTADVAPTGMAIVTGLDPTSTVLFDRYDEIVADVDRLGWEDLVVADRTDLLGLVPGDWVRLRGLLSSTS